MSYILKNLRTGKIVKVSSATDAAIISALDAKVWDKIAVKGATYLYIVFRQGDELCLRPVYQEVPFALSTWEEESADS